MIGGKVLDASALAALVRGRISALTWLAIAGDTGLVLFVPSLALAEVRAVRPDAGPQLADLVGHTQVVLGELDAGAAAASIDFSSVLGCSTPRPVTSYISLVNAGGPH